MSLREPAAERTRGDARRRLAAVTLLFALFVLHQDVWLWGDPRLVFGLPIGLTYHVAFCVAAALALVLAMRWSWPREVPADGGDDGSEEDA